MLNPGLFFFSFVSVFSASHPQHTARQQTQPQKFTKLFYLFLFFVQQNLLVDVANNLIHAKFNFVCVCVLVAQSCPTLCDPMDCSPPGSSVHGVLQARILGWVAIPVSKGSSPLGHRVWVSCIAGIFFTLWAARETDRHVGSKYLFLYAMFPFNFNRTEALLQVLPNC